MRQEEKLPFATMWMKLEGITLSEVSQRNIYDLNDMGNLNNKNTKKQAHINREQIVAVGWVVGETDERGQSYKPVALSSRHVMHGIVTEANYTELRFENC